MHRIGLKKALRLEIAPNCLKAGFARSIPAVTPTLLIMSRVKAGLKKIVPQATAEARLAKAGFLHGVPDEWTTERKDSPHPDGRMDDVQSLEVLLVSTQRLVRQVAVRYVAVSQVAERQDAVSQVAVRQDALRHDAMSQNAMRQVSIAVRQVAVRQVEMR